MAIDEARLESDDTRDINVNDDYNNATVPAFPSFTPESKGIGKYETNKIDEEFKYNDYAILVKVKKQKEDTVQMPGADFAQTNK